MSIITFIKHLFPFLMSAVEREYEKLPKSEQDALLQAGQFGQIIKTELHNGYDAIVTKAASALGLSKDQVDGIITKLAKERNININAPADFIDHLQAEVNAGMSDSSWDSLWTVISGQLGIVIAGGSLSWPVLALGLIQFVYEKFVKPKGA